MRLRRPRRRRAEVPSLVPETPPIAEPTPVGAEPVVDTGSATPAAADGAVPATVSVDPTPPSAASAIVDADPGTAAAEMPGSAPVLAATAAAPEPVAAPEPEPVVAAEPEPVAAAEPEPVAAPAVLPAPDVAVPRRRSRRRGLVLRFGIAFLIGLIAAGALGSGVIYAYEQQHVGRILPGVHVGGVDLSGADPSEAADRLKAAFGSVADGSLVIDASVTRLEIPYAAFARRADIDGMVAEALQEGRAGSPLDRAVSEVRTVVRGVDLSPMVTLDPTALADAIEARLAVLHVAPIDATATMGADGVTTTPATIGRTYDPAPVIAAALTALQDIDAPAEVDVTAEPTTLEPTIDDADVASAVATAETMTAPLTLVNGKESWALDRTAMRSTVHISPTVDGDLAVVPDVAAITALLDPIAAKVKRAAVDSTFLIGKNGAVIGATASKDGRALDIAGTAATLVGALEARAEGQAAATVTPAISTTAPTLTTAQAEQAAPLMTRISTWTTYFPISERNGFGANIWIPSSIINGYVLNPGRTFSFWQAIGPVTRERGYRDGGAIIDGHTEPTGALAGGMCSCSTTLFNAAVRAGLKMGKRTNHYYYIDRYPLGLDATVFKSGSGISADMTFTNDTKYPILIRGINTRKGGSGYVRFDLYSVPTGRTVTFSKPIVKDVVRATTVYQYTSSLAPGVRKQVEYPVDGKKVWVTRTVRDANGRIIHQETYYSNYKKVDGLILIGRKPAAPKPAPSPSPAP